MSKRARDKPERERQISEADDLDGVLNARAGGTTEREGHGRNNAAGRMPAAVVKKHEDAETSEKQIDECHGVERPEIDSGARCGEENMQWREQ